MSHSVSLEINYNLFGINNKFCSNLTVTGDSESSILEEVLNILREVAIPSGEVTLDIGGAFINRDLTEGISYGKYPSIRYDRYNLFEVKSLEDGKVVHFRGKSENRDKLIKSIKQQLHQVGLSVDKYVIERVALVNTEAPLKIRSQRVSNLNTQSNSLLNSKLISADFRKRD